MKTSHEQFIRGSDYSKYGDQPQLPRSHFVYPLPQWLNIVSFPNHTVSASKALKRSAARSHEMYAGKSTTCVCVYHGVKAIGNWQQSIMCRKSRSGSQVGTLIVADSLRLTCHLCWMDLMHCAKCPIVGTIPCTLL